MRALLLLGGTFSPVHLGHLRMAEIASESLGVSATFLINSIPPHKEAPSVTSSDRLRMLEIALKGTGFSIDTRELRRSSPSYTSETLREIRAERPHDPVIFIIGMDSFRTAGDGGAASGEVIPRTACRKGGTGRGAAESTCWKIFHIGEGVPSRVIHGNQAGARARGGAISHLTRGAPVHQEERALPVTGPGLQSFFSPVLTGVAEP